MIFVKSSINYIELCLYLVNRHVKDLVNFISKFKLKLHIFQLKTVAISLPLFPYRKSLHSGKNEHQMQYFQLDNAKFWELECLKYISLSNLLFCFFKRNVTKGLGVRPINLFLTKMFSFHQSPWNFVYWIGVICVKSSVFYILKTNLYRINLMQRKNSSTMYISRYTK